MKNYRINFLEDERQNVLDIVTRSNDVVLNQVEPEGIFFTIQLDDDQADTLYESLLDRIEAEVRAPRLTTISNGSDRVTPGSIL
jgi:hypothetical protein